MGTLLLQTICCSMCNLSLDDVLPFNKFKITHTDVQKKVEHRSMFFPVISYQGLADILDTRYLDLFRCYFIFMDPDINSSEIEQKKFSAVIYLLL